jgi:hypothetical protein
MSEAGVYCIMIHDRSRVSVLSFLNMRQIQAAAFASGLILALSGCTASTAKPIAPHITKTQMGAGATENGEVVNPSTEFPSDTEKIVCAWKAEGLQASSSIRGVWIAEDVGKAAPANFRIDEVTLHVPFANQGSLTFSKPDKGFPPGKYRVEIYLGTDLSSTTPFTVVAAE